MSKDDAIKRAFGKRVREFREDMDMTQEELGDRAGMHFTYIGQVERGLRNISLVNIVKLAKALKVSGDDLLPL